MFVLMHLCNVPASLDLLSNSSFTFHSDQMISCSAGNHNPPDLEDNKPLNVPVFIWNRQKVS